MQFTCRTQEIRENPDDSQNGSDDRVVFRSLRRITRTGIQNGLNATAQTTATVQVRKAEPAPDEASLRVMANQFGSAGTVVTTAFCSIVKLIVDNAARPA